MKYRLSRLLRQIALYAGLVTGVQAHAAIIVVGSLDGAPGQQVDISIAVDADTVVDSLDILPNFGSGLSLVGFTHPNLTGALCNDALGLCSVFYIPAKTFPTGTTLATWTLLVDTDAEIGSKIPLDLGIVLGENEVNPLPPDKRDGFDVTLAVPEPRIGAFLAVGGAILALIGLFRRRML